MRSKISFKICCFDTEERGKPIFISALETIPGIAANDSIVFSLSKFSIKFCEFPESCGIASVVVKRYTNSTRNLNRFRNAINRINQACHKASLTRWLQNHCYLFVSTLPFVPPQRQLEVFGVKNSGPKRNKNRDANWMRFWDPKKSRNPGVTSMRLHGLKRRKSLDVC